jgi:hypothetical protein
VTQPARRFIHVPDWDRFQHRDVTRNRDHPAPWIKDLTQQLREPKWLELNYAERGLLQSLRLEYAANRGRGLPDSTSTLTRLLGWRVYRSQLERLNKAGFIEFLPAERAHAAAGRGEEIREESKTLTADAVEQPAQVAEQVTEQPQSVAARGNEERQDEQQQPSSSSSASRSTLDDLLADGPPATSPSSSTSSAKPRPQDVLWNELVRVFGTVVEKTNAHAKRNRAVADLRRLGADVELVRHAVETYRRQYPGTPLTDVALATHYPQLTVGAVRRAAAAGARATFCDFCGGRGGLHVADCPRPAGSSTSAEQVA